MTLRNASSSKMKSRNSSERGGWVDSFDASLKIGAGRCRNEKQQSRPPHNVVNITPGSSVEANRSTLQRKEARMK
ncbi:hypothetical protein COCNU_scaffold042588G000010 [Cocos nucifera]|nr:hypothetical protein [Cocos nucifera]